MEKIAQILGIKLNEWFIANWELYILREDGLFSKNNMPNDTMLRLLLVGKEHIDIKVGDRYYMPIITNGYANFTVCTWQGNKLDISRFNCGYVFINSHTATQVAEEKRIDLGIANLSYC